MKRNADAISAGLAAQDGAPSQSDIDAFRQHFPVDEAAINYLRNSSVDVQWQVLQTFHPPREGEADYSALLISFCKRCRMGRQAAEQGLQGPDGLQQPLTVDSFRDRYPFDEEAYNYLMGSPPEVQARVMTEFKPPREGEADYSALIISFCKRCRVAASQQQRGPRGFVAAGPGPVVMQVLPGPIMQGPPVVLGPPPAELDAFRRRYPFDEEARNYLMSSAPEVQTQVIRTFRPQREGDGDYSALVISYTKRCRQSAGGPPRQGFVAAPAPYRGGGMQQHHAPQRAQYVQQHVQQIQPVQYVQTVVQQPPPMQYGQQRQSAPHQAQQRAAGPVDPELQAFRQRFPIDDRAFSFLCESVPEVRRQVLDSFAPPQLSHGDFSAPLVSYVKSCRARYADSINYGGILVPPQQVRMASPVMVAAAPGLNADIVGLDAFYLRYPIDDRAKDYLQSSPPAVVQRVLRDFRASHEGGADYSAAVVAFVGLCRKEAGWEGGRQSGGHPAKHQRVAY